MFKSKLVWRNWNRGREGRFRKVAGWGDAGFPLGTVVLFVASVVSFICEAVLRSGFRASRRELSSNFHESLV